MIFGLRIKNFMHPLVRQCHLFLLANVFLLCPLFAQSGEDTDKDKVFTLSVNPQSISGNTLSEKVAIELALERSLELQALNTNVQVASYRLDSSGKINNPELRLSDISSRYFTDEFDEMRIGFRWYLPKLGELAEEKQQAEVEMWNRKVEAIRFRHDLITKVRRNYASVIMYNRLVELEQKRVALETERIAIIERMVELGRRSVVYQTKARLWHVESKNDYARTVQRQHMAWFKLARRTGIQDDFSLSLEPLPEVTLTLDQIIEIAYQNRPEIELVVKRIRWESKQYNIEMRKLIPWPKFIDLSYHRVRNKEDWSEMRIGINLPIFNWNRGNIKATNLAIKRKELQLGAIREEIEFEVRAAYTIYRDFLLDWKNFHQEIEKLMVEAQNIIEQAKQHETLNPDEVLEMELTTIETQKILADKRRDLAHSLFDLCFVLGIEGPEQLQSKE